MCITKDHNSVTIFKESSFSEQADTQNENFLLDYYFNLCDSDSCHFIQVSIYHYCDSNSLSWESHFIFKCCFSYKCSSHLYYCSFWWLRQIHDDCDHQLMQSTLTTTTWTRILTSWEVYSDWSHWVKEKKKKSRFIATFICTQTSMTSLLTIILYTLLDSQCRQAIFTQCM